MLNTQNKINGMPVRTTSLGGRVLSEDIFLFPVERFIKAQFEVEMKLPKDTKNKVFIDNAPEFKTYCRNCEVYQPVFENRGYVFEDVSIEDGAIKNYPFIISYNHFTGLVAVHRKGFEYIEQKMGMLGIEPNQFLMVRSNIHESHDIILNEVCSFNDIEDESLDELINQETILINPFTLREQSALEIKDNDSIKYFFFVRSRGKTNTLVKIENKLFAQMQLQYIHDLNTGKYPAELEDTLNDDIIDMTNTKLVVSQAIGDDDNEE